MKQWVKRLQDGSYKIAGNIVEDGGKKFYYPTDRTLKALGYSLTDLCEQQSPKPASIITGKETEIKKKALIFGLPSTSKKVKDNQKKKKNCDKPSSKTKKSKKKKGDKKQ